MPDVQMGLIGSPSDVVNPLFAGEVKPEGIDLVVTRADGSTGYWRQFNFDEFDVFLDIARDEDLVGDDREGFFGNLDSFFRGAG